MICQKSCISEANDSIDYINTAHIFGTSQNSMPMDKSRLTSHSAYPHIPKGQQLDTRFLPQCYVSLCSQMSSQKSVRLENMMGKRRNNKLKNLKVREVRVHQ